MMNTYTEGLEISYHY